MAEFEDTEG